MNGASRHSVWLYDRRIGQLFHHDNFSWFEFTEDYLGARDRPVLGLRFEEKLRGRSAANLRLPPWFSNLLPEGVLREWIAAERDVSSEREMELIAQVGHDLPGAVRVLPDGFQDVPPVAEILRSASVASNSVLDEHQPWKFSLAGVGLKFSLLRAGSKFSCTATGEGGDWILKLPESRFSEVPRNEYTMMRFAGAVGIDVPEVRLVHRDDIDGLPGHAWPPHEDYGFAVERFDRAEDRRLVHIEDFAQVRGVYPIQKYEGNFETIASLAYRGRDARALREFARRLVFFVLIGNGDAHLKNWSLIYRDRRVPTLSPAYDIMSTEVYPVDEHPEDLGMKLAGSRRFETVRISQFQRLARKLGSDEDLADVARETIALAQQNWPRFADELKAYPQIGEKVGKLLEVRAALLLRSV